MTKTQAIPQNKHDSSPTGATRDYYGPALDIALQDVWPPPPTPTKASDFFGPHPQHGKDAFQRMQQLASGGGASGPLPDDHRVVTVYRNGFTVGDGPFRPLSDPLNKKFMDEMAAGRCPAELQGPEGSEPVHVAVHDKRGEEYKEPPAPSYVKFSGEGNTLGGSSSSTAAVEADKGTMAVDDAKPKTKLQIRFHDGTRKAQEFNEAG